MLDIISQFIYFVFGSQFADSQYLRCVQGSQVRSQGKTLHSVSKHFGMIESELDILNYTAKLLFHNTVTTQLISCVTTYAQLINSDWVATVLQEVNNGDCPVTM